MNAVELLVTPRDERLGFWPCRFRLSGREYVRVPGGPSTFWDDGSARFRVWSDGRVHDVTVRESDRVTVLTYRANGREHPRECTAAEIDQLVEDLDG